MIGGNFAIAGHQVPKVLVIGIAAVGAFLLLRARQGATVGQAPAPDQLAQSQGYQVPLDQLNGTAQTLSDAVSSLQGVAATLQGVAVSQQPAAPPPSPGPSPAPSPGPAPSSFFAVLSGDPGSNGLLNIFDKPITSGPEAGTPIPGGTKATVIGSPITGNGGLQYDQVVTDSGQTGYVLARNVNPLQTPALQVGAGSGPAPMYRVPRISWGAPGAPGYETKPQIGAGYSQKIA